MIIPLFSSRHRRASAEPATIRPAATADLYEVCQLDRVANAGHHRQHGEWLDLLATVGTAVWVAEQAGCVVGFLCAQDRFHHLEIVSFAVASRFRKRGIGTALVMRLVRHAKTEDLADVIHVRVPERALDAQCFLRTLGFRWRYTIHPSREQPHTFYLMRREEAR